MESPERLCNWLLPNIWICPGEQIRLDKVARVVKAVFLTKMLVCAPFLAAKFQHFAKFCKPGNEKNLGVTAGMLVSTKQFAHSCRVIADDCRKAVKNRGEIFAGMGRGEWETCTVNEPVMTCTVLRPRILRYWFMLFGL